MKRQISEVIFFGKTQLPRREDKVIVNIFQLLHKKQNDLTQVTTTVVLEILLDT